MSKLKLRKWRSGSYRATISPTEFAQFIKGKFYGSTGGLQDRFIMDAEGRHWKVEIRNTETGDLIRYAGIHGTLKAAVDEIR